LLQDRDDANLKLAELHRQVNFSQGHVISMEKDLRHVIGFYKQYEGEIEQESTNYSMQLRKNGTVKENSAKMESLLREQLGVCDSLDRDVKLVYESFVGLNDDNCLLEDDLEKYKEIIRVLGKQNDELMSELDRITEQDESVRFILDRKCRIDGLIEKAEVQCERNTIRQQSMRYSPSKR
jgi:cysteinyl-tRNA synthetase